MICYSDITTQESAAAMHSMEGSLDMVNGLGVSPLPDESPSLRYNSIEILYNFLINKQSRS